MECVSRLPVGDRRENGTLKPENRITFNSVIVIPV